MNTRSRWNVVLVDDHERSRAAVRAAVWSAGGEVVGEAVRRADAPQVARRARPDIAVVAVGLPDGDGIEAAAELTSEGTPVVLLTSHVDAGRVERAREAGVMGFLVKPLRAAELAPALDLAVARFAEVRALRQRLEERKLVERAKGILMKRHGLDEEEAFARMRRASMDSRRPMADIARAVLVSSAVGEPGAAG